MFTTLAFGWFRREGRWGSFSSHVKKRHRVTEWETLIQIDVKLDGCEMR
jgi:hypothetical protein